MRLCNGGGGGWLAGGGGRAALASWFLRMFSRRSFSYSERSAAIVVERVLGEGKVAHA